MYFVLHCALGRGPASLGEKILEGKETNLVTPSQAASQQAKAKVAFDDLAVPEAVALIVVWSLLRLNQGKFTLHCENYSRLIVIFGSGFVLITNALPLRCKGYFSYSVWFWVSKCW